MFTDGELKRDSVVANFATTAADGQTYQVDYYNLDVIISVGYRVKSVCGIEIFLTGDKDLLVLDVDIPAIMTMAEFLNQY